MTNFDRIRLNHSVDRNKFFPRIPTTIQTLVRALAQAPKTANNDFRPITESIAIHRMGGGSGTVRRLSLHVRRGSILF